MAKAKGVMLVSDRELFGIDREELRRITSRMKVVPYAKIDGVKITTCSIDEQALGLDNFIAGWNETGYYVRSDRKPFEVVRFMKTINWLRVARVKSTFDIRASGITVIRDAECWFITEKRYTLLMHHCSLTHTEEAFEAEVRKAIDQCKRNGQTPTNISGTEASH